MIYTRIFTKFTLPPTAFALWGDDIVNLVPCMSYHYEYDGVFYINFHDTDRYKHIHIENICA